VKGVQIEVYGEAARAVETVVRVEDQWTVAMEM